MKNVMRLLIISLLCYYAYRLDLPVIYIALLVYYNSWLIVVKKLVKALIFGKVSKSY